MSYIVRKITITDSGYKRKVFSYREGIAVLDLGRYRQKLRKEYPGSSICLTYDEVDDEFLNEQQ